MKQDNTGCNFLGKRLGGKLGNVGRVTLKRISEYISSKLEISHL